MGAAIFENLVQVKVTLRELAEANEMIDECYSRVRNARNHKRGNLQELQQELKGLRSKTKQLDQELARLFEEDSKLSSKDLIVYPLMVELEKNRVETMSQLEEASLQHEVHHQQNFQASISAIGLYVKQQFLDSDCFGWKNYDQGV
uniref:Uncharacterized protein n=1 Tax=Cryptomonas curvata TaxID=233186 RepID=A0A7S0M0V5_9CRYP